MDATVTWGNSSVGPLGFLLTEPEVVQCPQLFPCSHWDSWLVSGKNKERRARKGREGSGEEGRKRRISDRDQ